MTQPCLSADCSFATSRSVSVGQRSSTSRGSYSSLVCSLGGGHNKHGAGSRCTLQKQCRPPSPRRRWRCDRSSYKRSWFSSLACLFSFFLSFRVEGALGSLTPRLLNTQARSSLGSSKPDSDARTTTSRRTWRADVWESRAVQLLLPVRGCASARARARAHRSHANAMPSPSGNRSPSRQPAPRARRNIAARSRRRRR